MISHRGVLCADRNAGAIPLDMQRRVAQHKMIYGHPRLMLEKVCGRHPRGAEHLRVSESVLARPAKSTLLKVFRTLVPSLS
jgi:hypothetical protein